jgi:hypothetical protein
MTAMVEIAAIVPIVEEPTIETMDDPDDVVNDFDLPENIGSDMELGELDLDTLVECNNNMENRGEVSGWRVTLLNIGSWFSAIKTVVASSLSYKVGTIFPTFIINMLAPKKVKMITEFGEPQNVHILESYFHVPSDNRIVYVTPQVRWFLKKDDVIPLDHFQSYLVVILGRCGVKEKESKLHITYNLNT